MTAKEIVSKLTLEEKASLCSGKDVWHLEGIERLALPSIMVTDGPHGLRKQEAAGDNLGIFDSVPSTCFPAAAASACSFDRKLLFQIGEAVGEECLQEKVSVILGPGINIKRSPLCGRNFEYFSEDPLIAGELSAALIKGVQSKGVGTSLKHYAVNNQEKARFTCNSVIDERALREIYLAGFEIAVKEAEPWTVMGSYNQVNGIFACENKKLLTEILRDEWGFKGIVMTDWGAVNDCVEGIKSGCELEMPGPDAYNDAKLVSAVKEGRLDESVLDRAVLRLVELILKSAENQKEGYKFDRAAHHALARKIALESAVLLKNENVLPVKKGESIALIGAFAKTPRYQGAGSSRINPIQLDNVYDAFTSSGKLKSSGIDFEYAPGYSGSNPDDALIEEAVRIAKGKDKVIVFAGLPDEYESEGFDRLSLDMPPSHNKLIEALAQENPNMVVVLQLGSPVSLPWASKVKGIVSMYLGGEAGSAAIVDLLLGKNSPCGKLAETWPLSIEDTPCFNYFPGTVRSAEYRESIFTGYRYYDKGEKPVAYPFGYGLSYTKFEYSDLTLSSPSFKAGDTLEANFTVKNSGGVSGAEIAQVYVARKNSAIMRAAKELKGFEKVFLQSGESKSITIKLDARSFSYYNAPKKTWAIEGGEYEILAGASSREILLRGTVNVDGDGFESLLQDQKTKSPEYFALNDAKNLKISDASFEALYGGKLPPREREPGNFDRNSTLGELESNEIGKKIVAFISAQTAARFGGGGTGDSSFRLMFENMMKDMPIRSLPMMSGGMLSQPALEALIDALNGKPCADPALLQLFAGKAV